jgi:hypothetical protein
LLGAAKSCRTCVDADLSAFMDTAASDITDTPSKDSGYRV